jgi:hypothetical protein
MEAPDPNILPTRWLLVSPAGKPFRWIEADGEAGAVNVLLTHISVEGWRRMLADGWRLVGVKTIALSAYEHLLEQALATAAPHS